ncbi:MAG: hypothetical protein V1794_15725 [Candidatus Glassbacteria bacterium]
MAICEELINGIRCPLETSKKEDFFCAIHQAMQDGTPIANKGSFFVFILNNLIHFKNNVLFNKKLYIDFEFYFSDLINLLFRRDFSIDIKEVYFSNLIFLKKADFSNYNRIMSLKLENCVFKTEAFFNNFNWIKGESGSTINHFFKNIEFLNSCDFRNSDLHNITFKDVNLDNCLFLGTEFCDCRFINVRWKIIGKVFGRKGAVYDEYLKRDEENYLSKLSDLERIYRNLKTLSKISEDRDMEGEFNYSENEMIRKRSKWYKQPFTSKFWYFLASRYGERPSWAFINIILMILFWSLIYIFTGVKSVENASIYNFCNISWKNYLYILAHAFSPITLNKWQLTTAPNLVTYFMSIAEGAILAVQVGLFVMAFRRKFQR